MESPTLSEIWIYPIKSLAGISLKQWQVKPKGLQYDRRWMLVDENGAFMTQRSIPKMALFKTSLDQNIFRISHSGDSISLLLDQEPKGKLIASQVWDDSVEVVEVDETLSTWFSEKLGLPCKLVSFPEKNKREVDTKYIEGHEVGLADAYPFLIIGEQSLQDLNNRLLNKIEMKRFRPNFVFSGGKPFDEDSWRDFRIGSIDFVGVKLCSRCVLITVDPETALKGVEPLKTLASYRSKNNKVLFGNNLVARNEGEIKVGDTLIIKSTV